MTRKERILASLKKEETDRIPFGMWYHLPHVDQDPVALAETQIDMAIEYELDFIKMMPFGNYQASDYGLSCTYYCTPTQAVFERKFAIQDPREWTLIKELPGCFGNHGKTLMAAEQLKKQEREKGIDIPYIQTIFSPLTIAKKLAGERVFSDMREYPEYLHYALDAITKTCINFVVENINAGVFGFFFASQCSCFDYMTEEEYREFGEKYDLKILNIMNMATPFNVLHIHGNNSMYELLSSYPVTCINWHDRWVKPNLKEAREISNKCFMGGINENWLSHAMPEEIADHIKYAVNIAGRKGLIISPGCCADMNTPKENFYACRDAIKQI